MSFFRRTVAYPYVLSVFREADALRRATRLDRAAAEREQAARLADLLGHARRRVPFYRELGLAAPLTAETATEVLKSFPIIGKDELRRHGNRLRSDDLDHRRWKSNRSGGSTGEPTEFIQDSAYARWRRAVKLLFDGWTGYRPGERKVVLWGSERDLFEGRDSLPVRVARYSRNEYLLNAFRMEPGNMSAYVDAINRIRPRQVLGYANSLFELSRHMLRENLTVHSPGAVLSAAGTLRDDMRETIAAAFGAPVFNRYGAREVGDLACEFRPGEGLVVPPLTHYLELLDDAGRPVAPGEVGEVVVTSLSNFAMPLIRYRLGDLAVWWEGGSPETGPQWQRVARVVGRLTDVFRRADGGVVVPEYLIHLLGVVLNQGEIVRYQIIQESFKMIRVLLVLAEDRPLDPELESRITEKIRLVMEPDCQVLVHPVDQIPLASSGKFRPTISHVAQ